MRFQRAFLAASFLAAFSLTGCNLLSPTEPGGDLSGPDRYRLTTTMTNTSGVANLDEVQIFIDGNMVMDSCSNFDPQYDNNDNVSYLCTDGSVASLSLSAAGSIGPGSHSMGFSITQTSGPSNGIYTVAAFTIEVRDANGALLKSISLPAQTASLGTGGSIKYSFTI